MNLPRHCRFLLLVIVLIFFLLSSSSSFVSSEPANDDKEKSKSSHLQTANSSLYIESQIRKGKLAYRQRNYQLALEEWNKALAVDPHHKEASQSVLLAKEKLSQTAENDQATMQIPAHKRKAFVENQLRTGKLAYRRQDFETAYIELQKGHEIDPRNVEINRLMDTIRGRVPTIEATLAEKTKPAEPPQEPLAAPQPRVQERPIWAEGKESTEPAEAGISFEDIKTFEALPLEGLPLTLEQCIMIARANSLSVKIAREEAALARWKMAPARRSLWPSFDVLWKETRGTTTGQDFTGREMTLEFQKPLITWGKTKALFLQAKINWEIAKRNLQKEVTELDFKAEQAYFILANALKDVQDLHTLYDESLKDMKIAEQRYKLELARELEWLKVKSKADEIYYRVQSAEKDLILAQLTLSQILDSHSEAPFTVRTRLGPYDIQTTLEQCIQLALKNRSDLTVNEFLIEYNKLGQKIAKSEYKWNLNLEGSVGVNDEAFISESLELQEEFFVGLKLTKPFGPHTIEDNFLTQDKVPAVGQTTSTEFTSNTLKWYFWNSTAKINIKESDIKYLKAIDEYIKKRNSVVFEVKKNYYEYLKARQQLTNNLQKIKVAEEELKISVARLGLNEILDSELLEAKDRYSRSKSEYGQSLSGYYTAVANLNKSIGLTDYFDLKRGLQEETPATEASWQQYVNEPGEIGTLPHTEGYQEVIERLEGKKRWWQGIGGGSAPRKEARTTQELVEQTTAEGTALYRQGKYQEALSKFEAAKKLDPDNFKTESYIRKTKSKLGIEMDETQKNFGFAKPKFKKES